MKLISQRALTISKELKSLIYEKYERIDNFSIKEGYYKNVDEVDASKGVWSKFGKDDFWGEKDTNFWFRNTIQIPKKLKGKKVALVISTNYDWEEYGWDAKNPQFIAFVNKKLIQAADVNHRELLLSEKAIENENYQVDFQAYSGVFEYKHNLYMDLVGIHEDVRRLYYNIQVPLLVIETMDDNDRLRIEILKIINDTINLIDLREKYSRKFTKSVNEANEFIEKVFYEDYCGHEDVIATCIGHTHIDIAWWWSVAQTRQKVARSFSTVCSLMDEYPEYVFMSSQPQLYDFLKEDYEEIFERVKEKVKEGKWEPEGAMWVEADCNVISGESLVRQILFGTRFFEENFGVTNDLLWLPDVFGYCAALPQILIKSGINNFMTTKISWNEFNKLPCDTFNWKGIDGTEVFTHIITTKDVGQPKDSFYTTYNGELHPEAIIGAYDRYQQKDINNDVLVSFGWGDGGGGPTKEMLETGKRMSKGIPGAPKVKMGKALDYFKRVKENVKDNKYLPKWTGELYLENHRGTYTSMAKNKKFNRKCELLYQDVELLSTLAMEYGRDYNAQEINNNWKKILLNQFHDILPGTSIKEVYEVTTKEYEEVCKNGEKLLSEGFSTVLKNIKCENDSLVVYNTLSYDRDDIVEFDLPVGIDTPLIIDENNLEYDCQLIEDNKAIFYAKGIPSKGYRVYHIKNVKNINQKSEVIIKDDMIENKFFKLDFNEDGNIISFYDKVSERQVIKDKLPFNQLIAFEDKPSDFDNWNIDIYYEEKSWNINDIEKIEVVEQGPIRGCIKIYRRFLKSTIVQTVYVYRDKPTIDFETYINWVQEQILLKAAFPVDVNTDRATYEIQFGNVERPTHSNTNWDKARFEVCGQKWADLSEEDFGVSLLNDCKYGHDIRDGIMRLTLLKSGIVPNPDTDKGEHSFTYSIYPHKGNWKQAQTHQMAYNLNCPLYSFNLNKQEGKLGDRWSFANIDVDNVVIDTIKKAEDSDEIILRLYEFKNKRTKVKLTMHKDLAKVIQTNLMEKEIELIDFKNNCFEFVIKPYEIKTFKIKLV